MLPPVGYSFGERNTLHNNPPPHPPFAPQQYAGKYDSLYGNLIKKYGPLGQPSAPASAPGPGGGNKKTISDFSNEFVNLVNKATPCLPARSVTSVVEGKASDSANGLETR